MCGHRRVRQRLHDGAINIPYDQIDAKNAAWWQQFGQGMLSPRPTSAAGAVPLIARESLQQLGYRQVL